MVVDDGSDDDTATQAEAGGADVVVRCSPNRGKGAAVRLGVLAAHGRTVAFTDADLSYAPEQVLALLDGVEEGWDVVVGKPPARRDPDGGARRATAGGRRAGDQPADRDRVAGSVPGHAVRAQGDALRRRSGRVLPLPHRRVRVRRGGVPPGGAVPAVAAGGARRGGQLEPFHGERRPRRSRAGPRSVPHPSVGPDRSLRGRRRPSCPPCGSADACAGPRRPEPAVVPDR